MHVKEVHWVEKCRFVQRKPSMICGLLWMAEIMYHCRQKQEPVDKGISYQSLGFQPLPVKIINKNHLPITHPWGIPFSYLRLPTVTRCLSKMDCREKFPQLVRWGTRPSGSCRLELRNREIRCQLFCEVQLSLFTLPEDTIHGWYG